jgi:hypothetical protein
MQCCKCAGRLSKRQIFLLRWRRRCSVANATPSCTLISSDGRRVLDMVTSSCRIYDEPTINNQTGMPSAWCTDGKEYVLIDNVLGTRSQLFGRWTPIQQSSHPPTLTDVHDKEYTMSPRAIISTVVLSIDLFACNRNKMRLSWNLIRDHTE